MWIIIIIIIFSAREDAKNKKKLETNLKWAEVFFWIKRTAYNKTQTRTIVFIDPTRY